MPADQQAGEESISPEEMEASKRAKRAAYMRKYRANKKPADDASSSSSSSSIGENPVSVLLPRIRFNFRLPYGQSFMMTRLQFPLRRAFALSVHKSQGQTLERGLIDARGGFFAHGHLYVGMSRVTRYDKISLFVNWAQLYTDLSPSACKIPFLHLKPLLQNIVYPEAINEIKALTDAYDAEQAAAAAGGDVEVEGLA
jgi:hypothetical protein